MTPGMHEPRAQVVLMIRAFEEVDREKFPCLDLAYRALQAGGTAPTALNAANEVAVAAFLRDELPFTGIPELVRRTLEAHVARSPTSLEEILEVDRTCRAEATRSLERRLAS